MRVAIVGGGPSGLISAKHCLSSLKDMVSLDVYERLSSLGGVWSDDDEYSTVYDNLRTNLPIELMEFEGLKYNSDILPTSFVSAPAVKQYLITFAEMFQLEKYIKFQTTVTKVGRFDREWQLTARHLKTNEIIIQKYDVIFVCNGHYSSPILPSFDGLEEFKRNKDETSVIHSMKYRKPETYKGLHVLVVGAGPSAQDVSIDIASVAEKVYISHHWDMLLSAEFPSNVIQKPDVKHFTEDSVIYVDGTSCKIDSVILATGYKYELDFLDDSCGIQVEDFGYVTPLYKHLISIPHPTMVFIGLPIRTFLFPLFETQVKCMVQILNGDAHLPGADEMHEDRQQMERDKQLKEIPRRVYHDVYPITKQYLSELFKLGNIEPIEEVIFGIFEKTVDLRSGNLSSYRNHKFIVIDSNKYEMILAEEDSLLETEITQDTYIMGINR